MRVPTSTWRLRGRGSAGFATILVTAWMGVLAVVAGVGLALGVAAAGQHAVDSAADLVALSAASALQRSDDPCGVAASVAAANQVTLVRCRAAGGDVVVSVQARVQLPFGLDPWVTGQARAGPG